MMHDFRHEPTVPDPDRYIARPRLTLLLAGRFERRLTTIVAAAGYGKTTALAQAVRSNALDPIGQDGWLGAADGDEDPLNLLAGLLGSLDCDARGELDRDVETLVAQVWSRAPTDVALIIDDCHLLTDTCSDLLVRLLRELPRNAHLVVAGRSIPSLPLARLRVDRELLEIAQPDLELDDDELGDFTVDRGVDSPVGLSRHIASAELGVGSGPGAIIDYIREEVLQGLEPARLAALVAASVAPTIDDQLTMVLSNERFRAGELTAGLPLVEAQEGGRRRLHALLRSALAPYLDVESRRAALVAVAEVEQGRGRYTEACALYAEAGRSDRAVEAASQFLIRPVLRSRLEAVRNLRQTIGGLAPGSALHGLLEAHANLNRPNEEVITQYGVVADQARVEDDGLLEAIAVFRAIQAAQLSSDPFPTDLVARMESLAGAVPYAAGVRAHLRSKELQAAGDSAGALAVLDACAPLGRETLLVMRAERLCDLGRPEEVGADLTPEDLTALPDGVEIFIAFAMWLRGELGPEDALPVGFSMIPGTLSRGFHQPSVSLLTVVAHIAVAAGDLRRARTLTAQALSLSADQKDPHTNLFAAMASASVASAEGDDVLAGRRLDPTTTGIPFGRWPERPLLLGLPLVYLVRPDSREVLDSCEFGPSLAIAVRAGRALVELRDEASPATAIGLPWHQGNLLRVHVLPHHLVELAAAAASGGNTVAEALLEGMPGEVAGLTRAARSSNSEVARWAGSRLRTLPSKAPHSLAVRALGPIELRVDGQIVTGGDWVRRARVRELLGLLLEEGNLTRDRAAAILWRDLSTSKAAANLRVTLSHLQSALEPDRDSATAPHFVRVEGKILSLSEDIEIDVSEFDDLIERAHAMDRAGAPAEARDLFERAVALSAGPYMQGIDTDWVVMTRLRLDSLVRTAWTRLGELELARGEPERAARLAANALRTNDLDERAARVVAGALAAAGDRAGAIGVASRLVAALTEAGLEPDPQTRREFERLGWTTTG